jgi:hypothetical protein
MNKHFAKKIGAGAAAALAASQSHAYDWSTVTGAIDFSGEIAAVAAVTTVLIGVFVVTKGAKVVMAMVRGG